MHPSSSSHPSLPVGTVLDALAAAGFELGAPHRASRAILDTFDGRLHAAGALLELLGGPEPALVLSVDGSGVPTPPAHLSWTGGPPSWPAELPPGPFRERLAAVTRERALVPLFATTTTARTARRTDKRGKVVAQVEVHERIDTPGAPSWVATVVPVAGHDDAASEAEQLLHRCGAPAEPGGTTATVARLVGARIRGTTSSPTVPLLADDDAPWGFRAVLANLAHTVEVNLPGTVADVDSEFLHELRVAVRRTRSVLGQAKGVLPEDVRTRYADGFRWLGQVTTGPRDLDVYLLGWADYVSPLPGPDAELLEPVRAELERRRVASHRQLAKDLRSARATQLLASWRAWLHDDAALGLDDPDPLGKVVASRIGKAQRTVLRDGRAIDADSPGELLHDLRKDAKKLRYAFECFGSLLPTKPRKAFVGQLKALQDNLGEHQDAEVHVDQLRALARDLHGRDDVGPEVLLAMGRLSDHLDRRRQAAREEFAERFAAYDTKANAAALDALLGALR